MVTLKDISREIGLSVTQVSRALGGHADVNPDTRDRVRATADRLGYRPNAIARGLKTGRSGIIAMVVAGTRTPESNAHLFEIVMGLSAEISARGQTFVLHVAEPGADTMRLHAELYRSGSIDGFVLIGPASDDPRIARLKKLGAPFIVHGRDPAQSHAFVDIDNMAVGQVMADHLLRLGHRRIGVLNGVESEFFAVQRRRGVLAAHAAHGVAADPALMLSMPMIAPNGRRATLALLDAPQPPTAIIAGNTPLALGVYQAAAARGIRVPHDLSVLAHDDGLDMCPPDSFTPALGGTIAPLTTAWVALADHLADIIAAKDGPSHSRILDLTFRKGCSARAISVDTRGHAVP
ncbi:transcriptional regulator, LacI family [Loktanella fryxellensis]|uniref:Transcriptional regulator, LacI family n=1 Tax=Loktanella fryxellensis TaxID=245187 RepID=A0A1H8G8F0_9RHOB|nr:LacI family DNA-binding transcriptional regulator [Loktanella fryxellensis]SEN40326.1 transcriptional regulator, LacI family [Loktanella fryxellensis]